jgi:hypothetical protein
VSVIEAWYQRTATTIDDFRKTACVNARLAHTHIDYLAMIYSYPGSARHSRIQSNYNRVTKKNIWNSPRHKIMAVVRSDGL